VLNEILDLHLRDDVKARLLRPDGSYELARPAEGSEPVRSQSRFMDLARAEPARVGADGSGRNTRVRLAPRPA
jgi:polyphosphate kinase